MQNFTARSWAATRPPVNKLLASYVGVELARLCNDTVTAVKQVRLRPTWSEMLLAP